jgi:hypothetical protein
LKFIHLTSPTLSAMAAFLPHFQPVKSLKIAVIAGLAAYGSLCNETSGSSALALTVSQFFETGEHGFYLGII